MTLERRGATASVGQDYSTRHAQANFGHAFLCGNCSNRAIFVWKVPAKGALSTLSVLFSCAPTPSNEGFPKGEEDITETSYPGHAFVGHQMIYPRIVSTCSLRSYNPGNLP